MAVTGCSGVTSDRPDIGRLSDVALAGETPQADALAVVATTQDAETGLFGRLFDRERKTLENATGTGPDAKMIPFGESLPYGEIATVCDVPNGSLGTLVADVSGFRIYDTIPNATALRPHFITGFDDGCARQFTAALSMTGDVGTHEVVRYLPSNKIPFSATDRAYEAVKASYCRARQGSPCGSKLDSLARTTTFVTAYEKFGAHPRWVEILLHDGSVKAIDFKQK